MGAPFVLGIKQPDGQLRKLTILDNSITRLSTKKSLFPVQRVAVIVASRAAAIFFFFPFFFWFGWKILSTFGGGGGNEKLEKKVSSRPFFRHPAGPPETEFFFRQAQVSFRISFNNFTFLILHQR